MFDIGGQELILILVVVLILFGPKKLPELAQSVGRGLREFRKAQREFTDHINTAFEEEQRRGHYSAPRPVDSVPRNMSRPEPVLPPGPTEIAEDAGTHPAATDTGRPPAAAGNDPQGATEPPINHSPTA